MVDATTPTPAGAPALSPSPARVRGTIAAAVAQPDDLRQLRAFHKVMADVNRLRIVRRLAAGEATVAELIAHVGLCQPLVSWHLGRLRAAGVVETRRQGRETDLPPPRGGLRRFAARERAVLGVAG